MWHQRTAVWCEWRQLKKIQQFFLEKYVKIHLLRPSRDAGFSEFLISVIRISFWGKTVPGKILFSSSRKKEHPFKIIKHLPQTGLRERFIKKTIFTYCSISSETGKLLCKNKENVYINISFPVCSGWTCFNHWVGNRPTLIKAKDSPHKIGEIILQIKS